MRHLAETLSKTPVHSMLSNRSKDIWMLPDLLSWSCTATLLIISTSPKPGPMPRLNPCGRGPYPGVTAVCLSNSPFCTHLALHAVPSHLAPASDTFKQETG
jgi:hypothetical protein